MPSRGPRPGWRKTGQRSSAGDDSEKRGGIYRQRRPVDHECLHQELGAIRFAATAFLSYLVLARAINIARTAALAFSITLSVLRGQSVITSGVLGVLSAVVQTYRLQMALAPVATNIFTASLYSLQAGLYAVWTALGPVGG